jgi:hypothetical protein
MREIRDIYERWLDGQLAQEDALFAIGDILSTGESEANSSSPGSGGLMDNRREASQ